MQEFFPFGLHLREKHHGYATETSVFPCINGNA